MSRHVLPGLGVLLLLAPSSAQTQTPTIDHHPVACAVAEKFPRLEARFTPLDSVATARVVFQGQSPEWYSVAMKSQGAAFVGVLPEPKKSLKSFRYYIEVTDKALGTSRTADYTASVVESSSACKGRILAGTLASAAVVLQGPAGAAALPVGFASAGVVAAGRPRARPALRWAAVGGACPRARSSASSEGWERRRPWPRLFPREAEWAADQTRWKGPSLRTRLRRRPSRARRYRLRSIRAPQPLMDPATSVWTRPPPATFRSTGSLSPRQDARPTTTNQAGALIRPA